MKVVDKAEQIVGIIAEADQFIRVIPQGNVEDNLKRNIRMIIIVWIKKS